MFSSLDFCKLPGFNLSQMSYQGLTSHKPLTNKGIFASCIKIYFHLAFSDMLPWEKEKRSERAQRDHLSFVCGSDQSFHLSRGTKHRSD